jgi:hypothetical protein
MGIIKFAVKSGICIYAIKYTVDEGAWSSSDDAIKFKENCCNAINGNEYYQTGKSHFLTYVPVPELPQLPEKSELCYLTKYYWNQGVKGSIYYIRKTPCYIGQGVKKASDGITQLMNQPQPAEVKK